MSDTNVHRVVGNLHVGTSHFFVDTTTNQVGVNTSTPGAALDVQGGDVKVGSGITLANDGTITATGFSGNGSGLTGVNSDSGSWVNGSSSNIHLAVSTDKVGIGTVDPDGPLHLNLPAMSNYTGFTYQSGDVKTVFGNTGDDSTNTSFVQVYAGVSSSVPDTNSGTYNLALQPHGGNVGIGGVLQPAETLDILGSLRVGGDGMLTINERTNSGFDGTARPETIALQTTIDGRTLAQGAVYGHEPRVALALQPDFGYVGVGTTSPQTNLHIESSASTGVDIYGGDTSNPYIFIGEHQSTYSRKWGGKLTYYGDSNVRWLNISVVDDNVETAAITVRRNGHVGVGTESPDTALHVNGTIKAALLSMNGYTMSKPPRVVHIDDTRSGCPPGWGANQNIMSHSLTLSTTAYVYVSVTTILIYGGRVDSYIYFDNNHIQSHLTASDDTSWNPVNLTAGGALGAGTHTISFKCSVANVVGCQGDWGGMQILIFET